MQVVVVFSQSLYCKFTEESCSEKNLKLDKFVVSLVSAHPVGLPIQKTDITKIQKGYWWLLSTDHQIWSSLYRGPEILK